MKAFYLDKKNCILLLIIFAGAALRLFNLTYKSLWYDEALSLSFTEYDWKDIFSHRYIARPVYFLILKLWVSLFGYSELSARLPSVIFGVLSIILIYKLAKELFGEGSGLISAVILSLSSYHIYYSQEARNYSLFLFLGLSSMLIFVKILNKEDAKLLLLLVLINILLLYTHLFGIFIVIIQSIFFIIFLRKIKLKKLWIIGQVILIIAILPFFTVLVNYPHEIDFITKPNFRSLVEAFEVFGYGGPRQAQGGIGFEINPSRLIIPRALGAILFSLFAFNFLWGKKAYQKKFSLLNYKSKNYLLFFWLLFTILGAYIFSIVIKPIFLTRFLILTSAAFYIIIAKAITEIRNSKIIGIVISVIIAFSLFSLNVLYSPGPQNDWEKIGNYVRLHIKPQGTILLIPQDQIVPFWYYYKYNVKGKLKGIDKYGKKINNEWKNSFSDGENFVLGLELESSFESVIKNISELKNRDGDIWLVASPYWGDGKVYRLAKNNLEKFCIAAEVKYFEYNGVEVSRYSFNNKNQ